MMRRPSGVGLPRLAEVIMEILNSCKPNVLYIWYSRPGLHFEHFKSGARVPIILAVWLAKQGKSIEKGKPIALYK
jgi:hypothetical protein